MFETGQDQISDKKNSATSKISRRCLQKKIVQPLYLSILSHKPATPVTFIEATGLGRWPTTTVLRHIPARAVIKVSTATMFCFPLSDRGKFGAKAIICAPQFLQLVLGLPNLLLGP